MYFLITPFLLLCMTVTETVTAATPTTTTTKYTPNWSSLDSRPLPSWYDEAKLGIFVSWGLFSVPSFGNEWFWNYWKSGQAKYVEYMKNNFPPDFTYADFGPDFTAEFYNAEEWANLFAASGAKYIVFITKHHGGFCNWATNVSFNWNSMDVGSNRDLVGEMAEALKSRTDLHLGLYHSMFEWFHPLYLQDKANNYSTKRFVTEKTIPELYELVNTYKPDIVWSDGDWEAPDTYWGSKEFLTWLYNDSPVKNSVVTNDRWGKGDSCKHGGFLTCSDRYNPGKLQPRKWENAMTIDRKSWGFRREATLTDYLTIEEILAILAETVSCGGNLLINIGPTKYGKISAVYEERLRQLGDWMKTNGEAIYSSKPWTFQNDTHTPGVWYTTRDSAVYAIVLTWPDTELILSDPKPSTSTVISMLGYSGNLDWQRRGAGGIVVQVPYIPINKMPSTSAWVFKLTGITN